MIKFEKNQWALILGGSSGFGLATAKKLSRHGMNIFIVHRDRRGAMSRIEKDFEEIKNNGVKFHSMNINALSREGREEILNALQDVMVSDEKVRLVLHSIALGNLKLIVPVTKENDKNSFLPFEDVNYSEMMLEEEDMAQTIYNMGTNLLSWVQNLYRLNLFNDIARVIGLTSEGNQIAWRGYAAVSAAKVAMESISRSIAVEFGPHGIRSNIIQPGVTETPALNMIPGNNKMKTLAKLKNPLGRLTMPKDVANVICLLCTDEASWINGTIIPVDGGERIAPL